MKKYALITGASQGLGKSFAEELARRKINLILISLPNQQLDQLAKKLQDKYHIQAHSYATDLTKEENVLQLTKWVNTNYNIQILINNAGIGGSRKFNEVDSAYLSKMIQLNIMAPVILLRELLPNLKKQNETFVLNVSSLAAFSPMGYKTVYPASKAFIQSFSRGLNYELKNSGISISVVNPAGMKTNKETAKRIDKQGFLGKFTSRTPDFVAKYSIERMFRKTAVIKVNFLSWLVLKITPTWLKMRILSKKMKNEVD